MATKNNVTYIFIGVTFLATHCIWCLEFVMKVNVSKIVILTITYSIYFNYESAGREQLPEGQVTTYDHYRLLLKELSSVHCLCHANPTVPLIYPGGVLPHVFKNKAWGILHNLLEMFSYRLPRIPQNYRVHLISHIHSIAAIPHTNQNYQLHLW